MYAANVVATEDVPCDHDQLPGQIVEPCMDVLETVPEDETDLDRRIFDLPVIDSHMLTGLFVGLNGNAFTVRFP